MVETEIQLVEGQGLLGLLYCLSYISYISSGYSNFMVISRSQSLYFQYDVTKPLSYRVHRKNIDNLTDATSYCMPADVLVTNNVMLM